MARFKHSTPAQVRRAGYEVGGICEACDGVTDSNGYCFDCGKIQSRCFCPGNRNFTKTGKRKKNAVKSFWE